MCFNVPLIPDSKTNDPAWVFKSPNENTRSAPSVLTLKNESSVLEVACNFKRLVAIAFGLNSMFPQTGH